MTKAREPVFEGETDPRAWLELARTARAEGRFPDALRAHEYYHDNAMRMPGSGRGGVRLSFALSEWVTLARSYAPAKKALLRRRSEAAARALGPPAEPWAFHEALAIDWAFGDVPATIALMDAVEEAYPDSLNEFFTHDVHDALLARGEYKRCLRWICEPAELFNRAAGQFVFQGGLSGRGRDPRWARRRFLEDIAELTELLVGAGRTQLARRYVSLARKLYDHSIDDAEATVRARRRPA